MHHCLMDQLLERVESHWGDGPDRTLRELSANARAALEAGEFEHARAAIETLTSPEVTERFNVSWHLHSVFEALDALCDSDFGRAWVFLGSHHRLLPPNQLSTRVGCWFSTVVATKSFGGERDTVIRDLAGHLPEGAGYVQALDSAARYS